MVQSWGTLALVVVGSGTKRAGLLLVSSFDSNSYADEPKVTGPSACRPASSALLGFQTLAGGWAMCVTGHQAGAERSPDPENELKTHAYG